MQPKTAKTQDCLSIEGRPPRTGHMCRFRGCFGARAPMVKIIWCWAATEMCLRCAIFSIETLGIWAL